MQACTSHVAADASESLRKLSESDQSIVKEHVTFLSALAACVRIRMNVMV
jgi:hypothetical protein